MTINMSAYCQNQDERIVMGCNCKQIYTYKSSSKQVLLNNVILTEYYNDTLLIIKSGRFDYSRKFDFDNFIEYELRRDTFLIHNGIYSKNINGKSFEVLSPNLFNSKRKSIDIHFIQSMPYINRKIFSPKTKVQLDSITYFVFDVNSDSFILSDFSSIALDSILNIANYTDSLSYKNFGFDHNQTTYFFAPGWGFLKIASFGTAGEIIATNFVFTQNCLGFLKKTFKNWEY